MRENDATLQTHPLSTLNVKMQNLLKIDIFNFKYGISVGNIRKLFFLSHKWINKYVHKLEHKLIDYIAASALITPMIFILPILVNWNWLKKFQIQLLSTSFIWFSVHYSWQLTKCFSRKKAYFSTGNFNLCNSRFCG